MWHLSAKVAHCCQDCKYLHGHDFYLTKEEALQNDPSLSSYQNDEEDATEVAATGEERDEEWLEENDQEVPQKKQRLEPIKPPSTKEDFVPYKNVLPSPKILLGVKSMGNGQQLSSIFLGKNGIPFGLYFLHEDRKQIVRLLVETFERLALLVTLKESGKVVAAKDLWEKVAVLMTDSVEKNLKIEDEIAEKLKSNHKPFHTLCKAHTVEALDWSNIEVLAQLDKKVGFRNALESINPTIKSFLRGEKAVAVSAIKTILKFVSHDKSATSTNQADLFDYVVEREKKVKHISLYQERRFTKLGYSCASIVDTLPFIQMVVDETHLNNQHVEIVRMFLDSELLFSEFNVLSYFTYKISLPLLNAVEIGTQEDLCKIFPQLYEDLAKGCMDTLTTYMVKYRHIDVQTPSSELEVQLLKEMCHHAARTIELQCGRKYGFGSHKDDKVRATEIFKLAMVERRDLETNNIICEHGLGIFDHRAVVAKSRNRKFKAKSLRDDMVLHKASSDNTSEKISKSVAKLLIDQETVWNDEQKNLHRLTLCCPKAYI